MLVCLQAYWFQLRIEIRNYLTIEICHRHTFFEWEISWVYQLNLFQYQTRPNWRTMIHKQAFHSLKLNSILSMCVDKFLKRFSMKKNTKRSDEQYPLSGTLTCSSESTYMINTLFSAENSCVPIISTFIMKCDQKNKTIFFCVSHNCWWNF